MSGKNTFADKGTMHRYRIELPILIDDLELSVYEFRLYARFKRRAGDGGSCYEGARALAKGCGMSAGQVAKAKKGLEAKGLISIGMRQTRGGQTDDVTLIDLWPRNMTDYAHDESDRVVITLPESDHHTITLTEPITTRSLNAESDRTVNTLTSKRSRGDRKEGRVPTDDDDDDDGDGRTRAFLIDKGIGAAAEFAHLPYAPMVADYENRIAAGQSHAAIVKAWRAKPPTESYHYARDVRPAPADVSKDRTERPFRHNGTGGSDIKDPGWRERLIAKAEAGEL